jgi:hypothetical protein
MSFIYIYVYIVCEGIVVKRSEAYFHFLRKIYAYKITITSAFVFQFSTFETFGRFLHNLVGTSCHYRPANFVLMNFLGTITKTRRTRELLRWEQQ